MTEVRNADIRELSDAELEPLYRLQRDWSLENWPEDGFVDFSSWATWNRGQPPESRTTVLLASDGGEVRGAAVASWDEVPENRHLAHVEVVVGAASRRQGIGRRLLSEAAAVADGARRSLLMGETSSRTPAGQAFAIAAGASLGMVEHENRVRLSDVDRELLREWMRPAAGYRALQVDGPTPDDMVEEVAGVMELMNDAPRGDLNEEDWHERPDHMVQRERTLAAAGYRVWAVYAQHEESGRLVGFTRLSWHPSRPHAIQQWGTAVARDHRGHGLGRLVKATNLDRLFRDAPEALTVSTTNATTNRWMLAINHQLGFRPAAEWQHWQVETSRVLAPH